MQSAIVSFGHGFAGRVRSGQGESALWIHGYTLDSTCWSGVWEHLAGWRHVAVDLPGHGNSMPLERDVDLSTLAGRVAAIAAAQGARHLVAHSFGTILAIQVALDAPHAFTSMTLAAPMLAGGPFDPDVWTRYARLKELAAEQGVGPALRQVWLAPESSLFRGRYQDPAVLLALRRQVDRHPWWELADDTYARLWRAPLRLTALRAIELPTLLLVGQHDAEAVQQAAYFLERLVPTCERHDLSDVGHMGALEAPAEAARWIERHWRAHASSAAETKGVTHGRAARA